MDSASYLLDLLGVVSLGFMIWRVWQVGKEPTSFTKEPQADAPLRVEDRGAFERALQQANDHLKKGEIDRARLLGRDLMEAAGRLFRTGSPEGEAAMNLVLDALLARRQERDPEARDLAEMLVRHSEARFGSDDARVVPALMKLARVAAANSDPMASDHLRRAAALEELRDSPSRPLAIRIAEIGLAGMSLGLRGEARVLLERALVRREELRQEPRVEVATFLNLARLRIEVGCWIDAEPLLLEALPVSGKTFGNDPRWTGAILYLLGLVHLHLGKPGAAVEMFRRVLTIEEASLGPSHLDLSVTLLSLARASEQAEGVQSAFALAERALTIREQALGLNHRSLIEPLSLLGRLRFENKEPGLSRQALRRMLELQEQLSGANQQDLVPTLQNLSVVTESVGNMVEARWLIDRALKIAEAAWGVDDARLAPLLDSLGRMQWLEKDLGPCRATNERTLAIYRKELGVNHPAVPAKLRQLAVIACMAGDAIMAERRFDETLTLLEEAPAGQAAIVRQILSDLERTLSATPSAGGMRLLHRRATLLLSTCGTSRLEARA